MAELTINSLTTFTGLLLAARRMATDPDPLDRDGELAALAANGAALAAALRAAGLTTVAKEMAARAAEVDAHFTHDGWARDDARAVFWQVAPAAFADPDMLMGSDVDPREATDRMVAAIKASPHARDFAASVLAEPYFRAVTQQALTVMLARSD